MIKKAVALLLCIGLVFSNMSIVSAEEMSSDSEIAVSEIEEEVIQEETEEVSDPQPENTEIQVITESSESEVDPVISEETPSTPETTQNDQEMEVIIEEGQEDVVQFEAANEGETESGDSTIVDSGTCGENATWELDENGKLSISGTGSINSN